MRKREERKREERGQSGVREERETGKKTQIKQRKKIRMKKRIDHE